MIGAAVLLAAIGAAHAAVLVAAYTGPAARLAGGLLVVAGNYGLRRLLFLDPVLAAEPMAWFGLILLGDLVLALLVVMSLAKPAAPLRPHPADGAVAVLILASVLLAVGDLRVPLEVRAAHWKDEYFYLCAYALARLNGPQALTRPGPLAAVAVLAVAVAAWQAAAGPLAVDLAWIASGRSMLASGADAVAGAHGLGNLEAGWIRPYGFFGNGTEFGVFLAAVALLAVAARGGGVSAWLRPLPLLCVAGVLMSVVRFTWAVLALGAVAQILLGTVGELRRTVRLALLGGTVAALGLAFLAASPVLGDSGSLFGRAFVTGTYGERLEAQAAYAAHVVEIPSILLLGEGFGGHGSAAAKFGYQAPGPRIVHHSRLLDLVQDGGLVLAGLTVLPILLAMRGGTADPVRAAALAFCLAFLTAAALLGAKSALLQTLTWGLLGVAVARAPMVAADLREQPA